MIKAFFDSFIVTFFGRNKATRKDYETWARIEYRNDYQHALYHMERYGQGPSYSTGKKGINT